MVLAKIATLDHLCDGRITLGLVSLPEENEILGVEYDNRGQYSNEFIEVLRQLWTQDEATFSGKYWNFEAVVTSPKPLQKPHPPSYWGQSSRCVKASCASWRWWHPLGLSRRA